MMQRPCVPYQASIFCILIALSAQGHGQPTNTPNEEQPKVILGVLEDHPGIYSGDGYFRDVRALFQRGGSEWLPFRTDCDNPKCLKSLPKSYPQAMNWIIAFDGKELGRVEGRTPADFRFYSLVGTEEIEGSGHVPSVGRRSERFAGWQFEPVYRPLVAVSRPNFKDPEAWRPTQLSPAQSDSVRRAFRSKFPQASNCKNPDENQIRPWRYRDEDIKLNSAYSSKNNWFLVELGLTGWACDGPQDDNSPFLLQWYVLEPSGKQRFLGTGMSLVDAGDYDEDGKSEVLFQVDGYDLGGYRLFYGDFNKSAEFLFSYH